MSSQAFSRSDDLMVGAGVLYFQRSDDPNGWHHLGNVDEFTINNNIETIEKNSAMNKKRELMASVVTSVQPTGSLTMTEYNPYDLALGLFGREGVLDQAGQTITNQSYTVPSVPGIITVVDSDGNRCMDISDVVISSAVSTPATVSFDSTSNPSTGSVSGTVYTDDNGGTLEVSLGSYVPLTETNIYFRMDYPDDQTPVDGDLNGWTLQVMVGEGQAFTEEHLLTETGTTFLPSKTVSLNNGMSVTINTNSGRFSDRMSNDPILTDIKAIATPAFSDYKEGRDYVLDEQELRAGVIKIKSGGLIRKGDVVKVSCTVPTNKYITVSGADAGEITGKLLFIGDPNIGGQYNIEAWRVKVTPDGDLSGLVGSDFGTYTLQMRFLADYEKHPDYPYFRATLIGRASGDSSKNGVYDPEY